MHDDAARRAEEAIAKQAKWHHRIEVSPGVVTPGLQQTEDLLGQIGMPEDLTGMLRLVELAETLQCAVSTISGG